MGACVDHALGRAHTSLVDTSPRRSCGVYIFGAPRPGRLAAMATPEVLRAAVPELFDVTFRHAVGDTVDAFRHSATGLGWVLFDCDGPDDYDRVVARVDAHLGIRVTGT